MKTLIYTLAALCLLTWACKKGNKTDPFITAAPSFAEIKALEPQMSSSPISVHGSGGQVLPDGSVIVYKTNSGHYGKLKVTDVTSSVNSTSITFDMLTYEASGEVLLLKKNEVLLVGKVYDLQTGTVFDSGLKDFQLKQNISYMEILPQINAKFEKY